MTQKTTVHMFNILHISFIYMDYLPVCKVQIVYFWVMLTNSVLVLQFAIFFRSCFWSNGLSFLAL